MNQNLASAPPPPAHHLPAHTGHVISPLLLPSYLFLVLIFVPTLSIFICYFHRLMNGIVPGCVRVEGKGPPLQQPPLFPVCPSVVNILASSSGFVAFILRFSDTQIDFLLTKLYCGQNFKCYLEIN